MFIKPIIPGKLPLVTRSASDGDGPSNIYYFTFMDSNENFRTDLEPFIVYVKYIDGTVEFPVPEVLKNEDGLYYFVLKPKTYGVVKIDGNSDELGDNRYIYIQVHKNTYEGMRQFIVDPTKTIPQKNVTLNENIIKNSVNTLHMNRIGESSGGNPLPQPYDPGKYLYAVSESELSWQDVLINTDYFDNTINFPNLTQSASEHYSLLCNTQNKAIQIYGYLTGDTADQNANRFMDSVVFLLLISAFEYDDASSAQMAMNYLPVLVTGYNILNFALVRGDNIGGSAYDIYLKVYASYFPAPSFYAKNIKFKYRIIESRNNP